MPRIPAITALALITLSASPAFAQRTDPAAYQARVAAEVKPYLSDCSTAASPDATASCSAAQTQFAQEYYDALEGDQNAKFDIGFMFQRGDQFGVKYNPTMACAWWIELVNTGGRLPLNIFDSALAQACSTSPAAVAQAAALQTEEQRVTNVKY